MKKSKIIVFIVVMTMLLATLSACSTTKASFKINFEVDGEQYDSVEMSGQEVISLPADPTKEGYLFGGWYFDKDVWEKPLTMDSFLNEKLTSDMTVYARWVTIDECFAFAFTDETQSAYMIGRKEKATVPSKLVLPSEYKGKPVIAVYKTAFVGCVNVTSVTIPASVQEIGYMAFYCGEITAEGKLGPSNLTNIIVDSANANYKSIDGDLYSKDGATLVQYATGKKSTSVTISSKVTNIGYGAFVCCSSLTSVTIPASVTSIDMFAFAYCSSLTSVTIPAGVTSIDYEVFSGCSSLTSITIPASVTSIEDSAFRYCSSLTNITVESGNANYKSIDGNLYSKDGSTLMQYAIGKTATSFAIPAGVTSIGDEAFRGYSSLTSITIPEGVTSIGDSAFYDCSSLTSITIPEGVTSIGYDAFAYCSSLTSITIPASVTNIGYGAFYGCSTLTSVTIPAGVTSIGDSAFWGCSKLTIYAEAASKPAGWSSSWSSNCPVVWGRKN